MVQSRVEKVGLIKLHVYGSHILVAAAVAVVVETGPVVFAAV